MAEYIVRMVETVSIAITVETNTPEDAIELAYNSGDMPGSL